MTEATFLDYQCPHCTATISFPVDTITTMQSCIGCMQTILLPTERSGSVRKLPLPILTSRLRLRTVEADDWRGYLELFTDDSFCQSTEGPRWDDVQVVKWIESARNANLAEGDTLFLSVEHAQGGAMIGFVNISCTDDANLQASIFSAVKRQHQRQGYATEALGALLQFAFRDLGLHRVTASCDGRDDLARRLAASVGMRQEGVFLQNVVQNGAWADTVNFALLAEEHMSKPRLMT